MSENAEMRVRCDRLSFPKNLIRLFSPAGFVIEENAVNTVDGIALQRGDRSGTSSVVSASYRKAP